MRTFCLLILLALISCSKVSEVEESSLVVSEEELVGAWENRSDRPDGFLLGHYCDSFELRADNSFAIYYWSSASPESDRIDGIWRIEEENELIFFFYDSYEVKTKVISFSTRLIEIETEEGHITELTKK